MKLIVPAMLVATVLASGCGKEECKSCIPYTLFNDASPNDDGGEIKCDASPPTCLGKEEPCPARCEEAPVV